MQEPTLQQFLVLKSINPQFWRALPTDPGYQFLQPSVIPISKCLIWGIGFGPSECRNAAATEEFSWMAFSNFDHPPPGMTAYQSRYFAGEAATAPGLYNSGKAIKAMASDVTTNWKSVYSAGVESNHYVGDACGRLGGTPGFGKGAGSC